MNLYQLIRRFRVNMGDMGYAERDVIIYLNDAMNFIGQVPQILKAFEGRRSWGQAAHQGRYLLPALDAQRDLTIRVKNKPCNKTAKWEFEKLSQGDRWTEGEPNSFCCFDGKLELWPIPDADAVNTTLDGDITATATTITLASVTSLPVQGRVDIDNEVIVYTYIDGDNSQIKGCERGAEGTLAASHTDGATVTLRDIEWFGGLLPKQFFTSPGTGASAAGAAADEGSRVTDGKHQIWYTYYSNLWDSESLPRLAGTVTASSQKITVSSLLSSDDKDVDYVRIYMTKTGGTTAYYIGSVGNGISSYDITVLDAVLETASSYQESDVPLKWQDIILFYAVGIWFEDNEQYERANRKFAIAKSMMKEWILALESECGIGSLV